jgi:hypothetical protein
MKIIKVLIAVMFFAEGICFAQGLPSGQQQQSISPSSMTAVDSQTVQVTYTRKIPVSQLQIQCLNEQTQVAAATAKMNTDCAQSAQMVTATAALATSTTTTAPTTVTTSTPAPTGTATSTSTN